MCMDWNESSHDHADQIPPSRRPALRRDSKAAKKEKLELSLNDLDERIQNARAELQFRNMAGSVVHATHAVELETIQKNHDLVRFKLVQQQGSVEQRYSLHSYVSAIRLVSKQTGQQPSSSYENNLQGQVCRSIHVLCVAKEQLRLKKEQATCLVEWMNGESRRLNDEKNQIEVELLSRVFDSTCEKRTIKEISESILKGQEAAIDNTLQAEFNPSNSRYKQEQRVEPKNRGGRIQRRASLGPSDTCFVVMEHSSTDPTDESTPSTNQFMHTLRRRESMSF